MVVPCINGLQAASAIAGDAFSVVFAAAPRNASAVSVLNTAFDVNISVPAADLVKPPKTPRKARTQDAHVLCAGAAPGGPLLITLDGLDESSSALSLENSLTLATAVSGVILLSIRLQDLVRPTSSGIPEIMAGIERSLVLRVSGVATPLPRRRLFVVAVRDYESDQVEQGELENALSDRLSAAYNELDLPPGYVATEFSDLFDLHVCTFPIERHCAADFEAAVHQLGGFLRDANSKYADAGMTAQRLTDIVAKVQDSIRKESAEDLPEDKELTATFACSAIMQNVFDKYRNATKRWKATVDTGRIVANFGAENDRLIERTLEVYDKDASAFKSTAAYLRKREELKSRLLADSYALFAKQILKVRENAYQVFRAKLARIRITDKVEKNVRGAVKAAESFFVEHGEVLRSKLGSWRFDNERHELVNHMRDDATERLQLARLQGNYVPSIRAPIAFAFHTLLLAPFGKDSRMQVPYAEEMKQTYDPDKVKQAYIMRVRPFQRGQVMSVNSSDEFDASNLDQLAPLFEDASADGS